MSIGSIISLHKLIMQIPKMMRIRPKLQMTYFIHIVINLYNGIEISNILIICLKGHGLELN